jgi:ABC-2 type transport system permease protein
VNGRIGESLRIVWAITLKDVVEALKNKATLSGIIMVPLMIVAYKWMPTLYNPSDTRIVVYDEGDSRLVTYLENSPQFDMYEAISLQEMGNELSDMPMAVLGLVVPSDLDQIVESGQPAELDGYAMHWVSRAEVAELQALFEQQFTEWTGHLVYIRVEGNAVYAYPDSMGNVRHISAAMIVVILWMGLFTVPNLMLEEKQTKTLDALMVSPASGGQVVVGKTLTGLFYCLVAAGAALMVNGAMVVQWGLAIMAALSGLLLAVAIGLVLGIFIEKRQQMGGWFMVLGAVLFLPVFLNAVEPLLPEILRNAVNWMPTVALAKAFRFALSRGATMAQIAANLGVVVGSAVLLLAVVVWKVHRLDR